MKTSQSARRVAAAAVVAVLAALLVVTLMGRGNDQESAAAFKSFSDSVVPDKNTSQSLITPATDQWWKVVATLGGGSKDVFAADVPDGAKWLGFSSGLSTAKREDKAQMLTAFYIGFASDAEAEAYSAQMGASGANVGIFRATGNVVEMIPTYTNYQEESFPTKAPSVTGTVSRAHWYINITNEMAYLGSTGDNAKPLEKFVGSLGISTDASDPTEWTGTADSVDSGFVGKLNKGAAKTDFVADTEEYIKAKKSGKEPDILELPAAKANDALAGSTTTECPDELSNSESTSCVQTDEGLTSFLGAGLTMDTQLGSLGLDVRLDQKPTKISYKVGDDYDVVGLVVPKTIASAIAGSFQSEIGPLQRIEYAYSADSGDLRLKPILSGSSK